VSIGPLHVRATQHLNLHRLKKARIDVIDDHANSGFTFVLPADAVR